MRTPIMVWGDADICVRSEGVVEQRNVMSHAEKNLPDFPLLGDEL